MISREVKLRRLQRIKDRKRGKSHAWNSVTVIYWRYWKQVHGDHLHLWGKPESNSKRKKR